VLVAGGRDGEAAGCPPASGGETVVGQGRRLVSAVVEGRSSGRGGVGDHGVLGGGQWRSWFCMGEEYRRLKRLCYPVTSFW